MTKEELRELRHLDILINTKQSQIDDLRAKVRYLQATDYGRDRVQTSNKNTIEDLILKICDLEIEIEKDIDLLIDKKKNAILEINSINDLRYRTILELRYLKSKKWEEIAVETGYEYSWVLRLHGEALKKLATKSEYKV